VRSLLRVLLRTGAVILLAGAVFLVVMKPQATVASDNLVTKVDIAVQCSSAWSQWTHHANPAALLLNGQSVASFPAAQNSCASASSTIKHLAIACGVAAVLMAGLSLVGRRRLI
jgi:hypothetical protein